MSPPVQGTDFGPTATAPATASGRHSLGHLGAFLGSPAGSCRVRMSRPVRFLWGHPVWGSWAVLGASWVVLMLPWAVLRSSWAVLDPLAVLGPFGDP
eukprot:7583890-Pyramimonas_sp.AAC.1